MEVYLHNFTLILNCVFQFSIVDQTVFARSKKFSKRIRFIWYIGSFDLFRLPKLSHLFMSIPLIGIILCCFL